MEIYQPYHYPEEHKNAGVLSGFGLSAFGLGKYLERQQIKTNPLISHDPDCTPSFDKQFLDKAFEVISQSDKLSFFPIYRRNHTVGLVKEDDHFLLLDSYNAFGAKDADHIPLLRFLRENFKDSHIHTLHDKMQSDYHNCAFFTVQNLVKVERELNNKEISLAKFIQEIDTEKYHQESLDNFEDVVKMKHYRELGIQSVATPACLVPHFQSVKTAKAITKNSPEFNKAHKDEFDRFVVDREHKGEIVRMNTNIQSINDDFRRSL